jgi:hypothetical protein
MPRMQPRSASRAEYWVGQLDSAETGQQAVEAAWRWFRGALAAVAEQRPEVAEAARWDLARQIAAYASRLPRARIGLRRGLEPEEMRRLLQPWAPEGGGPR